MWQGGWVLRVFMEPAARPTLVPLTRRSKPQLYFRSKLQLLMSLTHKIYVT